MKKWIALLIAGLFLSGCASETVLYETISDDIDLPVIAQPREISVNLPGEAGINAVDGENGRLYLCDGYEISIETLDAGDLNETLSSICGHREDEMTVICTQEGDVKRYDFVWAAAGEKGDLLGRGVVLDDGSYHYAMTVLQEVDSGPATQVVWNEVFHSFMLV